MKGRVVEVDFNKYPKELYQLHNDFPLAPDGIEIIVIKREKKKKSDYQLKVV